MVFKVTNIATEALASALEKRKVKCLKRTCIQVIYHTKCRRPTLVGCVTKTVCRPPTLICCKNTCRPTTGGGTGCELPTTDCPDERSAQRALKQLVKSVEKMMALQKRGKPRKKAARKK